VNKNFLASLPAELQQVMKDAALEAGRFERAVAVAEVEPTKARCEQDGIRVIRFSEADEQTFRTVTARVYDQFANTFTAGLVDKIQKA
jgi:TRAP-type C4-dicarboxylate transport system substrate-binding protein